MCSYGKVFCRSNCSESVEAQCDIVDSERASRWAPGVDTVPIAETWDLCGGRRDGEPHLAKLCSRVHMFLCVWVYVCDQRQKESRASVGESSEEYSLIMAVRRGEGVTGMNTSLPALWSAAIRSLTDGTDELFP